MSGKSETEAFELLENRCYEWYVPCCLCIEENAERTGEPQIQDRGGTSGQCIVQRHD